MDFNRRFKGPREEDQATAAEQVLRHAGEVQITFGMYEGAVAFVNYKVEGQIGFAEAVRDLSEKDDEGAVAEPERPDVMGFAKALMAAIGKPKPADPWPGEAGAG